MTPGGGQSPPAPAGISAEADALSATDAAYSSASWRTSSATAAKPRPLSPARAASIAAFNASRLATY